MSGNTPHHLHNVFLMTGRSSYLLLVFASCVSLALSSDLCYNHQTSTYQAQFSPTYCRDTCTVTPFFSPNLALDTYVNLIESAEESIDIFTPSFDSWSNCTHYKEECDGSECIGCSLEVQHNEPFPVFPVLLNAVHEKGIKVRLVTNNYTRPTCIGNITPLDWFYLNGVDVRLYTTTTFQHAKYMMIDGGKKTAVSSVNWSMTSFTKNREAGVILEDCFCSAIDFYKSVFEHDLNAAAMYVPDQTYSSDDLAYITNKAYMNYTIPPPPSLPGVYMPPLKTYSGVSIKKAYTAPDNARDTVFSFFSDITSSFQLSIYQVTDDGLCDELLSLSQSGINVTMIVSDYVLSGWKEAQACYLKLYNGGLKGQIRKSYGKLEFSHEKYWIIDSKEVHLSTGNWSPSDFPKGSSFYPYSQTGQSVNRDLLVVMESPGVVDMFQTVFNSDWSIGSDWVPKTMH